MNPLRYLPRFQRAYRELNELAARQSWPREQIEAFQLERVNRVWQHAVSCVPYYRELAANRSLPSRFDSLGEFRSLVPILQKSTVRAVPRAFLSSQAGRGQWRFTSGSTGEKICVYWSCQAHLEMLRAQYCFRAQWGLDIFDRVAYLWGSTLGNPRPVVRRMIRICRPWQDRLRNRIRLSADRLGVHDLRRHLHSIRRYRPAAIYGYATAIYLLAQEALETGYRCDSLKLISLTAEPAAPHFVKTVESAFGVPAVIEYGSTECSFIAADGPDRTLRVREDVAHVETLPRDDGRYDIVLSVLTNPSYPLLRYAMQDITDLPIHRPPHGFAYLKNVTGRDNDLVVSRSGRRLHPLWFDKIFEATEGVRRWRVHQRADGALSVDVEPKAPGARLDMARIEEELKMRVEGFPVQLNVVAEVPKTAAGKHRWIVSEMVPG